MGKEQMTSIAEMLQKYRKEARSGTSIDAYTQKQCDTMNALPGTLTGYDCPICKNKGVVYETDGKYIVSTDCKCVEIRRCMSRIRESGLQELMERYTFDSFRETTPLQKRMKETALDFLREPTGKWMFFGGQVGCGKTHICTATVADMLRKGVAARYMLWRQEAMQLRSVANEGERYQQMISPLISAPVLYIDDFFKPSLDEHGHKKQPTPGDINVAFDIINARYINRSQITVISSEWIMDEIQNVDPGIGSRIYERAKLHFMSIAKDSAKNYRLK